MKIAVDFDNTLIEEIQYPCLKYTLKPHAREVIERLSSKGVVFMLHTARTGWFRLPAILFIKQTGLPVKTFLFNKKLKADIYIDDSNLYCSKETINWLEIEQEVLKQLSKRRDDNVYRNKRVGG